ncbi:putative bromodomain-containing protein 10 [Tachypleus tridentatus]|uniref:putative bromodomain-containing protein 10 n=1 Tax=Tachypleus tridentatus TaxID=6853 RepID=UPI003FD05D0F
METETYAVHNSVEKTRNNDAYSVPELSEIDEGEDCEEIKLLDPSESRTQQTQTSLEDSEGSWNCESNMSHSSTTEKELIVDSDMDSENSLECLDFVSFVDESTEHTTGSKTLPKKGRKPRKTEFLPAHLDCELVDAFRVVSYLMSESNKNINWPFLEAVRHNDPSCPDYYEVIVKPVWLSKVKSQILDGQYSTITNVVRDLRQMFANCYLYNGASHPISKRALKLETVLEQRLALLPKEMIEKTSLKVTSPEFAEETLGTVIRRKTRYNVDHSLILSHMMKERSLRAKEAKRRQVDLKRAEQEAAVQKVLNWESELVQEHINTINAMWELPQIGHFLYLTQRILNIPDITQYELERAFLIPQASSLMCVIMTTLLSNPQDRAKLDQKSKMPYKVWHERLKIRINTFYKVFCRKNKNPLKVFETLGVEPDFFKVLGPTNLLEHKPFHKLSLQQKVWIVKSLCDYCLHSHSTIIESLNELPVEYQKEQALGEDREGNTYIYFPHFGVRRLDLSYSPLD